jgi:hypothetical protein
MPFKKIIEALDILLVACERYRSIPYPTRTDFAEIEILYYAARFSAQGSVTLPPLEECGLRIVQAFPWPESVDGGKTWKLSECYRTEKMGDSNAWKRWSQTIKSLREGAQRADGLPTATHNQTTTRPSPKWDRPSRQLTVDGQPVIIAKREAPRQFAVLDLLENAGWPTDGVAVPRTWEGSLKDAVDALNDRLVSTRLRICRLNNDHRLGWTIALE